MGPQLGGHLEGGEGELCEQLDEAQRPPGVLVHHEGKDDLMGPQQGDECQCGLGKSGGGAEMSFWTSRMDSSSLSMPATPTKAWVTDPPIPSTLGQAAQRAGSRGNPRSPGATQVQG